MLIILIAYGDFVFIGFETNSLGDVQLGNEFGDCFGQPSGFGFTRLLDETECV